LWQAKAQSRRRSSINLRIRGRARTARRRSVVAVADEAVVSVGEALQRRGLIGGIGGVEGRFAEGGEAVQLATRRRAREVGRRQRCQRRAGDRGRIGDEAVRHGEQAGQPIEAVERWRRRILRRETVLILRPSIEGGLGVLLLGRVGSGEGAKPAATRCRERRGIGGGERIDGGPDARHEGFGRHGTGRSARRESRRRERRKDEHVELVFAVHGRDPFPSSRVR
jgi:hypothetical protein